MSKPLRVTLPRLFAGQILAGCDPAEFEAMTPAERLCARLSFIAERAAVLAALPYDAANGMPANIHSEARRLHHAARRTLELIGAGTDAVGAAEAALAVGERLERVQVHVATAAALDVTGKLVKAAPDIRRGAKVHSGSKSGAETTNEPYKAKWPEYQLDVDETKARNPRLSYAEICRRVAQKHGVHAKTIERNTTAP